MKTYFNPYGGDFMFFGEDGFSSELGSVFFIDRPYQHHYEHARPFCALSYRLSGNAVFNRGTKDEITAKDGCIALVPSNLSYNIEATGEKLICIHFYPSVPLSDRIRCFHTENRKYFDRKFSEILEVWQKKPLAGRHECMSLFYRLIYMIEREYLAEKPDSPAARIIAAAEYINEHLTENISIGDLADSASMSETYFRRLFTQKFGMSPVKYISKMRANFAKELLGTGCYSVSEIAARCGFNDVNYFSLFMKKQTGLPPSKLF